MSFIVSQAVKSDRLQALTRALDSAPAAGGKIKVYGTNQPSAGTSVTDDPLAVLEFPKPSLSGVVGGVMTLNNPAPAPVLLSGSAQWARLENGAGDWVADASVGTSNAAIVITTTSGTTQLFAGGMFSVSLATLSEV